jgi:putative molybdopterin biosynthesis protein
MTEQHQFLQVVDRDTAEQRFHAALDLSPLQSETIALSAALNRTLAVDVISPLNVPGFDRADLDGFAVQAADTFQALEQKPRRLRVMGTPLRAGMIPITTIESGMATPIATGAMLPRGADAVVMIEHTEIDGEFVRIVKPVSPGFGVTFAGTDISRGELVMYQGQTLTSRETGVLAALGIDSLAVWRRPHVAVISTGNEVISPGHPLPVGKIYDSNQRMLADAITEIGGVSQEYGIVSDDLNQLRAIIAKALSECDMVLLTGGTSKGIGDLSYQVVREFNDPGIVVHGIALKPGKPLCLAVTQGKPLVVLPGFPTSAIFTFHEFVAPMIRRWAGCAPDSPHRTDARLATKVNSEIGRTEYMLVNLLPNARDTAATVAKSMDSLARTTQPSACHELPLPNGLNSDASSLPLAFPLGKGSGSVTAFASADGFIAIDRQQEMLATDTPVTVQLIGATKLADLIVMGSHCVELDKLLSQLQRQGFRCKFFAVGSSAGLQAVQQNACDLAGIHLLDSNTGKYNAPFISHELMLHRGYPRRQGIVFRAGDERFAGIESATGKRLIQDRPEVFSAPNCVMINRNQGSGTRILIDQLLGSLRPSGYSVQAKNHHAVTAAIVQNRADWGVAIEAAARDLPLGFIPIADEQFDFVIHPQRLHRPAVKAFLTLLNEQRPGQDSDGSGGC